jgi:hypothetical protein
VGGGVRPDRIDVQLRDDLDGLSGARMVAPMTCINDQLEHAVTEVEFVRSGGSGRYRAMCGTVVLPGSMFEPPGRACDRCLDLLYPPAMITRTVARRVRAVVGWLFGRLVRRGDPEPVAGAARSS